MVRSMDAAGPNAEQITYWNDEFAKRWVAEQEALDRQLEPFGQKVLDALPVGTGDRVLDVGCGCGATSLALARRVGPTGRVVGVDVSAPMLERARERARDAGLGHLEFLNADAQIHAFPPAGFDALCSRFGVMFFIDPIAAFTNLARALRPGAGVAFVCWQPLDRNPWMAVPMMAAAQQVPFPPPPGPDAPGPFAFRDRDRVRGILETAGFVQVAHESFEPELRLGGTNEIDDAVRFVMQLGPVSAALREAGGDAATRVRDAIRDALRPFHGPDGVRMASAAWVVSARRA